LRGVDWKKKVRWRVVDFRRLEKAIDEMHESALSILEDRDQLAAVCLQTIACCGPSSTWQGKTQAFLERMEELLGRMDPAGLKSALAEAEASTHCS
jgi:hypothetical protein